MTDITNEQRAAVEWLRATLKNRMLKEFAETLLAALPSELTNPQPALPTEPGWYLAPVESSPSGVTAIELLRTGEWVDSTDSQYLRTSWVTDHMPLTHLVPARRITREQLVTAFVSAEFGLGWDAVLAVVNGTDRD